MIRLLLADSEEHRERWKSGLPECEGIEVAGEAGSVAELLPLAERTRPHVILLGFPAGEEQAADLLGALGSLQFNPGIIVAAHENDPEAIRTVIRLQARDFLPATCAPDDLQKAVNRVYASVLEENRDRTGILLALWGCRGGAGTTSLALTLAGAARRRGIKAAVADGDIALGDSAFLMNTRPALTWVDWARDNGSGERDINRYLVTTEEGFSILAAPKSPAQAELIRPKAVSEALELLLKSHDLVIADLHRGFDEITLHIAEQAQRLWLVTDASLSGVKDISLLWNLLDQLRLVHEERASVINRVNKGNAQTAAKLASLYKGAAIIPEEPGLDRAWESGRTPVRTLPRSPFVKGVDGLLGRLFPEKPSGGKGKDRR
jgi:Flp pilus assembly CpaE family ATPase